MGRYMDENLKGDNLYNQDYRLSTDEGGETKGNRRLSKLSKGKTIYPRWNNLTKKKQMKYALVKIIVQTTTLLILNSIFLTPSTLERPTIFLMLIYSSDHNFIRNGQICTLKHQSIFYIFNIPIFSSQFSKTQNHRKWLKILGINSQLPIPL